VATTITPINHSYHYYLVDVVSNVILGELPFQNVTYSNKLSSVGDFSAEVKINNDTAQLNPRAITIPSRTALYVVRDTTTVWGGIIWKREYGDRGLRITAKTFESYFYHRNQLTTMYWSNADQLDIARWLLTSNGSAAAIGATVSTATSPRKRERAMFSYEMKTTGLELEQLAGLIDGFDWNVFINQDAGTGLFTRHVGFSYPQAGVSQEDTPFVFEYPGSIATFTYSEDAENGGNSFWMIGAGEGTEQLVVNVTDAAALASGALRLDLNRSFKSVVRPSTLYEHAYETLDRLRAPVVVFEVTVNPDIWPELGAYSLGDYAVFKFSDQFMTPPYEATARITEINVAVDTNTGLETVTLGLGGSELAEDSGSEEEI
jgi:hypothetical protein